MKRQHGFWDSLIHNASGTITVTHSILSANTVSDDGGGIFETSNNSMTIDRSLLAGNSASSGFGGGIFIEPNDGTVNLFNSTLSNNVSGRGGVIFVANPFARTAAAADSTFNMTILNSTLPGNSADEHPGIFFALGSLSLGNSIIANSTDGSDAPGADCSIAANGGSAVIDLGHNLIESSTAACGLTDGVNGNIIGQDPELDALADNGGPTTGPDGGPPPFTFALLPNSPAIGVADQMLCTTDPINNLDQRGFARDVACDIGAFELNGVPTAVVLRHTNTTPAASASILLALLLYAITVRHIASINRRLS